MSAADIRHMASVLATDPVLGRTRRNSLQRERLWHLQGGRCAYCGRPTRLHARETDEDCATVEHVVPASRGGPQRAGNIVLACRKCNHGRGSRVLAEFLVAMT